jgi:biopolymer transport protein TolQ
MWTLGTIFLAQSPGKTEAAESILDVVLQANGVVAAALILLLILSLVSWYIIGYKWYFLSKAEKKSRAFLGEFWAANRLDVISDKADEYPEAPMSKIFDAGYKELIKLREKSEEDKTSMREKLKGIENVERALRRSVSDQMNKLESKVAFLATVGSTSPFIGLFGTVWGIMGAFLNIHQSQGGAAGIDVVAQPIAEALIVTAAGLFAAIPAVIFNNFFASRIDDMGTQMKNFADDFLNIVDRNFFE